MNVARSTASGEVRIVKAKTSSLSARSAGVKRATSSVRTKATLTRVNGSSKNGVNGKST